MLSHSGIISCPSSSPCGRDGDEETDSELEALGELEIGLLEAVLRIRVLIQRLPALLVQVIFYDVQDLVRLQRLSWAVQRRAEETDIELETFGNMNMELFGAIVSLCILSQRRDVAGREEAAKSSAVLRCKESSGIRRHEAALDLNLSGAYHHRAGTGLLSHTCR